MICVHAAHGGNGDQCSHCLTKESMQQENVGDSGPAGCLGEQQKRRSAGRWTGIKEVLSGSWLSQRLPESVAVRTKVKC